MQKRNYEDMMQPLRGGNYGVDMTALWLKTLLFNKRIIQSIDDDLAAGRISQEEAEERLRVSLSVADDDVKRTLDSLYYLESGQLGTDLVRDLNELSETLEKFNNEVKKISLIHRLTK
ncbi:hypothetical protein KJ657_01960 [Patescibacteria group bacterium]|nr:hypothetical protein [Patescibacteria group bacterium]MBU1015833.1 hypothetical protein [Patescibacteria group bacterium]MBU1685279.1 hypothetical protein [Patescibacteria group bacterium]MBU1938476.1 hypothetical protein [Patescibacteria group bacterium]